MDVVIEMLGVEPISAQVVPPSSSIGVNMELTLVSFDQIKIVPAVVKGAPALGSSTEVAIVRVMVNPKHSFPADRGVIEPSRAKFCKAQTRLLKKILETRTRTLIFNSSSA